MGRRCATGQGVGRLPARRQIDGVGRLPPLGDHRRGVVAARPGQAGDGEAVGGQGVQGRLRHHRGPTDDHHLCGVERRQPDPGRVGDSVGTGQQHRVVAPRSRGSHRQDVGDRPALCEVDRVGAPRVGRLRQVRRGLVAIRARDPLHGPHVARLVVGDPAAELIDPGGEVAAGAGRLVDVPVHVHRVERAGPVQVGVGELERAVGLQVVGVELPRRDRCHRLEPGGRHRDPVVVTEERDAGGVVVHAEGLGGAQGVVDPSPAALPGAAVLVDQDVVAHVAPVEGDRVVLVDPTQDRGDLVGGVVVDTGGVVQRDADGGLDAVGAPLPDRLVGAPLLAGVDDRTVDPRRVHGLGVDRLRGGQP